MKMECEVITYSKIINGDCTNAGATVDKRGIQNNTVHSKI